MNLFIGILIKLLTLNIPKEFYYFFIILECMICFIDRDFVSRYFKIIAFKLNPLVIFIPVS